MILSFRNRLRLEGSFLCRVRVYLMWNIQVRVGYNTIFGQTVGHFFINLKLHRVIAICLKEKSGSLRNKWSFTISLKLSRFFAVSLKKYLTDWDLNDHIPISLKVFGLFRISLKNITLIEKMQWFLQLARLFRNNLGSFQRTYDRYTERLKLRSLVFWKLQLYEVCQRFYRLFFHWDDIRIHLTYW